MEQPKVQTVAVQAGTPSHNSSTQRYEQWKRMDLSAIVLETLPKQVNKAKVLNDLLKLHSAFEEDLNEET